MAIAMMAVPQDAQAQTSLGQVIQGVTDNGLQLRHLFSGAAYMMGLLLGAIAIKKLKDHIENPNSVPLMDPMKRFIAGGAFFALPYVVDVVRATIEGDDGVDLAASNFNGAAEGTGLDAMVVNLIADVFIPLQWMFGSFGYIAGIILVMVGISRLLKSEQDGPRGPAGIGTIMTFAAAGLLFSINSLIMYFTESMFFTGEIMANGVLEYQDGLGDAVPRIHAVISAIIAFSMIIGWISMIRGIFILRGVSEGNSQASVMAAVTHLIGGALAINLGGVIDAVQYTLGIDTYGIAFS